MLHELVPMMAINIQSHVKKCMIITEYLLDHSIPRYNTNTVKSTIIKFWFVIILHKTCSWSTTWRKHKESGVICCIIVHYSTVVPHNFSYIYIYISLKTEKSLKKPWNFTSGKEWEPCYLKLSSFCISMYNLFIEAKCYLYYTAKIRWDRKGTIQYGRIVM